MAERPASASSAPPPGVDTGIYARDDGVHARFSTGGDASALDTCVAAALEALGDDAYGTDDNYDLASIARRIRRTSGPRDRCQLGIGHRGRAALDPERGSGPRRGRSLHRRSARHGDAHWPTRGRCGPPGRLLAQDANGRSRVRVALSGGGRCRPTSSESTIWPAAAIRRAEQRQKGCGFGARRPASPRRH